MSLIFVLYYPKIQWPFSLNEKIQVQFFHIFLQCLRTCCEDIIYIETVCEESLENGLISSFFKYIYSLGFQSWTEHMRLELEFMLISALRNNFSVQFLVFLNHFRQFFARTANQAIIPCSSNFLSSQVLSHSALVYLFLLLLISFYFACWKGKFVKYEKICDHDCILTFRFFWECHQAKH